MRSRGAVLGAVALLTGIALAGCATPSPSAAPTSAPSASAPPSRDTGLAAAPQDPVPQAPDASTTARPVRVVIPSIGVDAPLVKLARDAAGVLEAPPSDELDKAGWYAKGTVPGQTGPAVIAGHVDWVDRIAVFHRLHDLEPGASVAVRMSDGSTVRFTVDRTRAVSKFRFPTESVYGPTPDAQLRLITCGGPWDDARNIYSENVIVYATRSA
ncbi:class F sortase [Amnibacterium endophyticum]|uniref:Class F sortase n=1 Tax=Amnibacterium endophyticum TaxID=2109337 RepID=A0ABW4LAB4_9MICO